MGGTFCLPRGCLKRPKNEGQEPPISSLLEVHIFTKNAEAPRSLKNKIRGFYISCQQELFPQVEQLWFASEAIPEAAVRLRDGGGGELFALSCAAFSGASAGESRFACPVVFGQDGVEYSRNVRVT